MLDDVAILRDKTMEPSLEELQDSIEQLTATGRLENDVKAMGQAADAPEKDPGGCG